MGVVENRDLIQALVAVLVLVCDKSGKRTPYTAAFVTEEEFHILRGRKHT